MRVRTPIEKLARDICWAGFATPREAGCSKAAYWARLPGDTRAAYKREAEWFVYLLARMDLDVLNEIEEIRAADFNIVRDDALDGG